MIFLSFRRFRVLILTLENLMPALTDLQTSVAALVANVDQLVAALATSQAGDAAALQTLKAEVDAANAKALAAVAATSTPPAA